MLFINIPVYGPAGTANHNLPSGLYPNVTGVYFVREVERTVIDYEIIKE